MYGESSKSLPNGANVNFYKRHIGDYARDTSHLTLLEHGVYARLLDVYYARESPIPAAEVERLIQARTHSEKAALANVLREFFELCVDAYSQSRCDREINDANKRGDINRKNGVFGGRPKKPENPNGFKIEPKNNLSQTPDTRHQTPDTISPPPDISNRGDEIETVNTTTGEVTPKRRNSPPPPTLAEVEAEALRIGIPAAEAEKFLAHHEARGWVSGKTKIVDWRRAMITWRSNFRAGVFNRAPPGAKAPAPHRGMQEDLTL
jgi:uncharacterized protein YdaU (DUF1376 family)